MYLNSLQDALDNSIGLATTVNVECGIKYKYARKRQDGKATLIKKSLTVLALCNSAAASYA